jgi:hypothetical protein
VQGRERQATNEIGHDLLGTCTDWAEHDMRQAIDRAGQDVRDEGLVGQHD